MKKIVFSASLFICFTPFSLPVFADEEMDALLSMSLEELTQVEITGSTLTPESIDSVPSAVTVFTYQQLKRMGLDSLDELMNIVPGFQSYRSTRSSINYAISSRGRRIANAGSEILLLMDGQRLNDPRTGGSFLLTSKLPLMQIERVEFIRGPGSAVYGSNAMLGVVNIITRSNVNETGVAVGSFDRRQGYLQASRKTENFSLDLFAYLDQDKGDKYLLQDTFSPNMVETEDPRELANFNLKLKWNNTQVNIQHNQARAENFYEQNNISNGFNQRETEISFIALKQGFSWLSVNSFVQASYSVSRFFTAGQLTSAAVAALLSGGAGNEPLFLKADFNNYSESRLQWHNDWAIRSDSRLQFGAELRYIDAPETLGGSNYDLADLASGNIPIGYYGDIRNITPIQAESTRNISGVYLQYQQALFETTQLTLGLRYDDFSGIGSELSPRFALVQTLNQHHSLKLLYGEAFRAPTENELNLLNNPVLLGNPNLKPETVKTWDFIWLGQWSHTTFSLGYFENHFDDSIVRGDIGGGTIQFMNAEQGPSKGFEFEASHEFNQRWLVRASYTHFTEMPETSLDEADLFYSFMLNYQRSQWNANIIASYFDQRITMTGGSSNVPLALDGYWQTYAKLSYHFTDELQTFVQLKNMLDEDYQTPTASAKLNEGAPNRGREVLWGVIWSF